MCASCTSSRIAKGAPHPNDPEIGCTEGSKTAEGLTAPVHLVHTRRFQDCRGAHSTSASCTHQTQWQLGLAHSCVMWARFSAGTEALWPPVKSWHVKEQVLVLQFTLLQRQQVQVLSRQTRQSQVGVLLLQTQTTFGSPLKQRCSMRACWTAVHQVRNLDVDVCN
jgi:hypothetical protein